MVEFAKNLANFAAASGKKHVVLLSSLDFGKWQKIDMSRYFNLKLSTFSILMYYKVLIFPVLVQPISLLVLTLEI